MLRPNRLVAHGFDAVAVRIDDECRIVGAVVFRAQPGRAIVAGTCRQGFGMEAVHARPVGRAECHMCTSTRAAIVGLQPEIVGPFDAVSDHGRFFPEAPESQRRHYAVVEVPCALEIRNAEGHVINDGGHVLAFLEVSPKEVEPSGQVSGRVR